MESWPKEGVARTSVRVAMASEGKMGPCVLDMGGLLRGLRG
jgi:hypothetical protein